MKIVKWRAVKYISPIMQPDSNSAEQRNWLLKWEAEQSFVSDTVGAWGHLAVKQIGLLTRAHRHTHTKIYSLSLSDTFPHSSLFSLCLAVPIFFLYCISVFLASKPNFSLGLLTVYQTYFFFAWNLMCVSLQWSSGLSHLSGLGYDCCDHLLLHLHDVRIPLHQGYARPHPSGIKKMTDGSWTVKRRDKCTKPVASVSDWGVCICDLHEHWAQPEDHGRRSVLHPDSCHQRLWRRHGHLYLSREKSNINIASLCFSI